MPHAGETVDGIPRPQRFADVKGWFWPVDQLLFDWFLRRQSDREHRGDLLELGAYLGKSAIFTGNYLRPGERFTVCDLWDSPAVDDPNSAEMDKAYATLTRRAFETNYLAFHDRLPTMVQGPTSVITSHVDAGSCRFVHVDASHLYEHVRGDIEATRELLAPEGIAAFDDFRSEHCPGVAAAVWAAVATSGLKPIVVTSTKLYGTWGDPAPAGEELLSWLRTRQDLWHAVDQVAGAPLIRIRGTGAKAPAAPVSRHAPPRGHASRAGERARAARRIAKDLVPPVLVRAVRAARHRRTS
ncbi:class I SAM-dependent methyltransferase [Actinacidiphila sp. bgisy167]|uniref:class I SAM-dependent methyltransferase n=1 Tax=Actinacidiphila sp. bgisy167 TaxID=3413797 RepID=UPI003D710FA3